MGSLFAFATQAIGWCMTPKNWPYIGVGAVCLVLTVMALTIRHDGAVIVREKAQVVAAQGQATVAGGDAKAATAAAITTASGADRDAALQAKSESHAHALSTTAGHDAPIARPLNDAARGGLCDYAAERDDPACVQLRSAHP